MVFLSEPPLLEEAFRNAASRNRASPKLWADACVAAGAKVVTFDQALASRCKESRLLTG